MAFLAHQQQIRQMLAEGYPQLLIHQKLHKELNELSYSQFSRLIRKYIFGRQQSGVQVAKTPISARTTQSIATDVKLPSIFRGFEPGPKVPDIDELF